MTTWHLIEGEPGCAFARDHGFVAIVVDTLRASATAAMLLDAGATEVRAVRHIDEARALKSAAPAAVLLGERGGLPPADFDAGNSPARLPQVEGRAAILCTTTGTARVVDAIGSHAIYMGTTVNATAVAKAALAHERDVVLIPAGREGDPMFDAHEDWAGASAIALIVERLHGDANDVLQIGEGAARYREMRALLEADGVAGRIDRSLHAGRLRELGLGDDVSFCGRLDVTRAVPRVATVIGAAAILRDATERRPAAVDRTPA